MGESPLLDATFWAARMSYLCRLARVDALAVVVAGERGYLTYAAHNVPADIDWLSLAMILEPSDSIPRTMSAAQPLADGRVADGVLAAPVAWKTQRAAALVGLKVGPAPAAEDLTALARVAELVALELAEALAQRGSAETNRELQREAASGPQRLLEKAIARLAQLFRADGVSIMLADESGELSVRAATGLSDLARRDRKKIGEGISGTVARTGQAVRLEGPVRGGSDPTIGESLVAPLRTGGRTIGVVNVKHREGPPRYDDNDLNELTGMASDIAGALATAQELERANDDRAQAILLYELARFALGADPAADLESAAAMLCDALRQDAVGLWIKDSGTLRLRASQGYGGVLPHDVPLEALDPTMHRVIGGGETARASFGAVEERPDWAAYGATHFLIAPMRDVGALVMGRAAREHSRAEADFALVVADFLAALLRPREAPAVATGTGADREGTVAEERRRFAQELHDGLAQELTGLVLGLESAHRAIGKDSALAAKQLARSVSDARGTLLEVRRYMAALRQASGTEAVDLPVLLARLVEDLRRQTGLEVEVDESGLRAETDRPAERALLRIIGEALRNVSQHSGASRAKVSVEYRPDRLVAIVQDDGKGFDVEKVLAHAESEGHFGILGMRERGEGLGGQVLIRSEPGHGTVVHATIPFDRPGGTIEDVEPQPAIEDTERVDATGRAGLLGLFRRR